MHHWNYYGVHHERVEEKVIDPAKIFFSQDSIARLFRNHQSVNEAALKLISGELRPDEFPNIQVVRRSNGLYYALDNRRLYAFRVARIYGVIREVKVLVIEEQQFHGEKFTSRNGGTEIVIRGATTYDHWKSAWNEQNLTSSGGRAQIRRTHAVSHPQYLVNEVNRKPDQLKATTMASCFEDRVVVNSGVASFARTSGRLRRQILRTERHTDIIGKMGDLSIDTNKTQARYGYSDASCQLAATATRFKTNRDITTLRQAIPSPKHSNDCKPTATDRASTKSTSPYSGSEETILRSLFRDLAWKW